MAFRQRTLEQLNRDLLQAAEDLGGWGDKKRSKSFYRRDRGETRSRESIMLLKELCIIFHDG